ncbi:MAG: hypothetical protein AMXMBFR7_42560 [Planctomycetota bacterium]
MIANIRATYMPTAMATAGQLQPTQNTAKQPKCSRMNGTAWKNARLGSETETITSGLGVCTECEGGASGGVKVAVFRGASPVAGPTKGP